MMGSRRLSMRRIVTLLILIFSSLIAIAVCVSCIVPLGLPTSGRVVAIEPAERKDNHVFTNPDGPGYDAQPESIVEGMLNAMPAGVQNGGFEVAREFMTAETANTWKGEEAAVIYAGSPTFVRKANTFNTPQTAGRPSLTIEVRVRVMGRVDQAGVYEPADSSKTTMITYTLMKSKGQWRVTSLPTGVMLSHSDFNRVYRSVSLYFVDSTQKMLIPDTRWFGMSSWRIAAVRHLLQGASAWMGSSVMVSNPDNIRVAVSSVPIENDVPVVKLSSGFDSVPDRLRALLVRQIRMTLGDGNPTYDVEVLSDSNTLHSTDDKNLDLSVWHDMDALYSLSAGHIVSLGSSSPIRIADVSGIDGAHVFLFSGSGGAVLRSDYSVECIKADGSSCGLLFDGRHLSYIVKGVGSEIWGISQDGRTVFVSRDGKVSSFAPPWLSTQEKISALSLSPEGLRMVALVDSGDNNQVAMLSGIERDEERNIAGVSEKSQPIAVNQNIVELSFFDATTLVSVVRAQTEEASSDRAFKQKICGPNEEQKLPVEHIHTLTSGRVQNSMRIAALDDSGNVRALSGTLDGSWAIVDSNVSLLSKR